MAQNIAGIVDRLTQNSVVGWARNPDKPGHTVEVSFYLNGAKEPFYTLQASEPRTDLDTFGIDNIHGFSANWPTPLQEGDEVVAGVVEANMKLHNTPLQVGPVQSDSCLYSPQYNYMLYYNYKSACTLLRQLFIYLHEDEAGIPDRPLHHDRAREAFRPPAEFTPELRESLVTAVLVRNPWDRVVSMFIDKVASYCYEPELCSAEGVFEWAYPKQEHRYRELNFMDFLRYLRRHRFSCDAHFRPQPLIHDATAIMRVENLEADLIAFYTAHLPELLPRVRQFLAEEREQPNRSANTAQDEQLFVRRAPRDSINKIAAYLAEGQGIEPASFFSRQSRYLIQRVFGEEAEFYGYQPPQTRRRQQA